MTGKLDWLKLESMFTLGGYEVGAELSNSSALLALVALNLIQPENIWIDYTESDDIQAAIAVAIDELTTDVTPGGSGNMIKIAESSMTSDSEEAYIDDFDSGTFNTYKLEISGMLSDNDSSYNDHVELEINEVASNNAYLSFGLLNYIGVQTDLQNILNYPSNILYWQTPTVAAASSNVFGNVEITFPNPQLVGHKQLLYRGSLTGYSGGELLITKGSGGIFVTAAINKILIRPYNGDYWLAGGSGEPSELLMTLYGLN